MIIKLRYLLFYLALFATLLNGSVGEYQEIYDAQQSEFVKEMRSKIKKAISSKSKRVQEAYRAIDYQPVWIDSDYLTQYSELLYSELKDDFDRGLNGELIALYEKLQPSKNHKFASPSIEDKVNLEIGIMELYLNHIDAILKGQKSRYNAITLLQYALKERSLISAINEISKERISYRSQKLDSNSSKEESSASIAIKLTDGDEKVRLGAMYKLLNFKPIWIDKSGLSRYSKELFRQIESDPTLAHDGSIYRSYKSLGRVDKISDHNKIIQYELKIAKLYQAYMSHLLYGNIDWKRFQRDLKRHHPNGAWVVHNILSSPESLLIESLKSKTLNHAFKEAKPLFPLYDRMLKALDRYQSIVDAGGWEELGDFADLKPNMRSAIVPKLVERLKREGDYNATIPREDPTLYDQALLDAVVRFQERHGLVAQGYIGKMTKEALSESAEHKVSRIKLNLDRLKWLKREDERYHIYVNIPAFEMYLFDGREIIESMGVIVGRSGHETPIFYGKVRTIVLNPYWRIPSSIIRHELIPKLQKDPSYTHKKKIEIHTGYSEHSPLVDPHSVNWHKYGKRIPPYKFMQTPGSFNALGKVKYLFPNPYSVYMHDTNERYLFEKQKRALSHGCIRLHKPFKLLESFSQIDKRIDYQKSKIILEENKKTPLRLANSIPIDTLYLTSWADKDGRVEFRNDIYGYDEMQLATLKR
ncbi:Peptidoglycan-binding domain 1 [hydrothermal vent metagenome]|uniref:Peptidoglycan-binding domain 1 n=1 Tax=hydrothermal vent metagenome TaxID=652676 RepID=A0A1W1BBC3_9ZZZZ